MTLLKSLVAHRILSCNVMPVHRACETIFVLKQRSCLDVAKIVIGHTRLKDNCKKLIQFPSLFVMIDEDCDRFRASELQKEIQQIVETMGVSKGSVKIGFQSDYLLNSQQMLPDWDIPETLGQFHEYYRNNTGFYPTLLIITAKRFSPPRFQIHARYQSPRKNMVPNHRFFTDRYKLHRVIVI
jgi:hypothetical protein